MTSELSLKPDRRANLRLPGVRMRGAPSRKTMIGLRVAAALALLHCVSAFTAAEQLPIRTYTTDDGLGSTFTISIVPDSKGFLWFCTRDGLSRFDGHRFVAYTMENGLPNPTINHLLETRDGVYWIATNGGGVCRFNPRGSLGTDTTSHDSSRGPHSGEGRTGLFTTYRVEGESRTNHVNVLYQDRSGQVWAGTDGGLFRIEEEAGQVVFRRVEIGLPSRPDHLLVVSCFLEDRNGDLWIGTIGGLTRRLPDGRMAHYTIRPSQGQDWVGALLEDQEGRLWIGHSGGGLIEVRIADLVSVNDESVLNTRSTLRLPQSARYHAATNALANRVLALHQTAGGHIWIGTHGGLGEFDGDRLRIHTTAQGLIDNRVRTLAEDLHGNLWIGGTNGAMKLTLKGFRSYAGADGLSATQIHSIYEGTAGEVYVVSGNWFVNRLDGERFHAIQAHLPSDAMSSWASPVGFLDRAGGWWMLTTNGLHHF